jgi:aspartate 1-decarboxylase
MAMSRKFLSSSRLVAILPVLTGMLSGMTLAASGQAVVSQAAPRILSAVNPAALTTLRGNTLPLATAANDHGRLPDATPTGRLMLQLKPSAQQKSALDTLVAAQLNPKSPSFHKWLTPATFGKQFGASDADIQTVTAYLSQQGFNVSRVLPNKLAIEFSGTTGQLRSAFKTEIHSYTAKGQTFVANDRDPQIPTALMPVVAGFSALNSYQPVHKPLTGQSIPVNRKGNKVRAQYTDANNFLVSVSPGDLAQIYDIPTSATGSGVTIGLVGTSNVNLTYYQNFRTTFDLGAYTPSVVIDGDDPGIGKEADLDLIEMELVSAVAPAAKINYYTSASSDLTTGLNFSLIRAINDDAVQVLILTQENCEANLGLTDNEFINNAAEFASALGITVVAKSGNGGSAECDSGGGDGSPTAQAASKGLAVNGYASSPYVTAVGATDFYYPPDERTVAGVIGCCWNETNGGTAGYTSAKGYIREQPWNDSNGIDNGEPFPELVATGGGPSTLGGVSTDGTTAIPYAEPLWQIPVVPITLSKGARVVPDVSMFGADAQNGSIYMTCVTANECVGGSGADDSLVYGFGAGTESSAAVFGGVAGLVVQAHGAQGTINPTLYSMYLTAPSAFHDVTIGTNTVYCVSGSPNCGSNGLIVDSTGAEAFSAVTGYDAASGLGSVDVANLISKWSPPNTATSSTTFSLTTPGTSTPLTTFVHGTTVQTNITVTGSSTTPTGDVALIASTAAPSLAAPYYFTLTNGSVTDTNGAGTLGGGTYQIKANYGGDSIYAASVSAPVTVTISPETSKVETESLSFTPGSAVSYGTSITAQLYVFSATNPNSIGTPTGSLVVTDAGSKLTVVPLDSQGYGTFTATLPVGAHTLGFSYSGDASYQASSLPANLNVSVNAQGTTTTLASTDSNDGKKDYAQLVAVVSGSSTVGGTTTWPAGTVSFMTLGANATTLGTVTVVPGTTTGGKVAGIANFQVKGANLPNSPTLLAATFTPATPSNYASSISNIVSVTTTSAAKLTTSTTTVATADGAASYFDYDGSITLNLGVTSTANPQPTGTVSVFDNGVLLGTATLSSGTATYTINQNGAGLLPLTTGRNVIIAQYNGDTAHATSTKQTTFTILDEGSLPDFSLQSDVVFGTISTNVTSAAFNLQLTSINNFAALGQKVTFAAAVPTGITCTFGQKNVAFSTTGTYATNTVTCGAATGYTISSVGPEQRPLKGFWLASGGATLACVFLLGIPARRRQWRSRVGMLVLILGIGLTAGATIGMTGCGSNAAASSSLSKEAGLTGDAAKGVTAAATKTLAPGTYQVLITATAPFATKVVAGSATLQTHTLPLQIVVQ